MSARARKKIIFLTVLVGCVSVMTFSLWPILAQAGLSIPLEISIGSNTTAGGIVYYIGMIYRFATLAVGAVAVVMIIIGGIQYATAAGSAKAIGSAKETIISAIIGLVVVLLAYLILGVFSTRYTNLNEPALDPIDTGQASCLWKAPTEPNHLCDTGRPPDSDARCAERPSGGADLICCCGADLPGRYFLCNANNKCVEDDSITANLGGCSAALAGRDCQSYTVGCDSHTAADCEQDTNCKLCDMLGQQTCILKTMDCASNCTDLCQGFPFASTCMTTKAACDQACSPFEGNFSNGVCSGCNKKTSGFSSMNECQQYCGNNCTCIGCGGGCCCTQDPQTEYDNYRAMCNQNKQFFQQTCATANCGAPQEVNKNGALDFCCTNK